MTLFNTVACVEVRVLFSILLDFERSILVVTLAHDFTQM